MQPGGLLWQPAEPAGVDDVDDGQRAAIVEIEQAELGGGEVPEDPFTGQPPVRLVLFVSFDRSCSRPATAPLATAGLMFVSSDRTGPLRR
jgi:hypothetical protein